MAEYEVHDYWFSTDTLFSTRDCQVVAFFREVQEKGKTDLQYSMIGI